MSRREEIAKDPEWRFLNKYCPLCGGRLWKHPKGFVEECEDCIYHIVGG